MSSSLWSIVLQYTINCPAPNDIAKYTVVKQIGRCKEREMILVQVPSLKTPRKFQALEISELISNAVESNVTLPYSTNPAWQQFRNTQGLW